MLLCIRFCVLAHLISDVFALSCFVKSAKESRADCFYVADAQDMVAMNDAHGTCVTCHHVVFIFCFILFQQCVNANIYAIPESWFIHVTL